MLWRVAGVTTRARVIEPGRQVPVGLAVDGTATADPYLDQAMPDGSGDRALLVGASSDSGWVADVVGSDGTRTALAPVTVAGLTSWSAAFVLPDGAPQVDVRFDGTDRSRWMWLQLVVLLVLVVMALPERRRQDPDPDTDDDVAAPAMESAAAEGSAP